MDDTPRSGGFGTPRDDRFFTPRAFSTNTSSSGEEWITPRRDANLTSQSDVDYDTPRGGTDNNGQFYAQPDRWYRGSMNGGNNGQGNNIPVRKSSISHNNNNQNYWDEKKSGGNGKRVSINRREDAVDYDDEEKGRYDHKDDEEDIAETLAVNLAQGATSEDVEDIFSYARHGRTNDIERLLDRGVPVNVRDSCKLYMFYQYC